MRSTASHKAWRDLSRRRTRSILTVLTLALAVGSIGMLAVPSLLDRAMNREVRATKLYDIALPVRDAKLSAAQLDQLRTLPNVTAVSARVSYPTRVRDGVRKVQAIVWSVPDFPRQNVDVVRLESGRLPAPSELFGDSGNAKNMNVATAAGDRISIVGTNGAVTTLPISGAGRSLAFSQMAGENDSKHVVLYGDNATVRALAGTKGYNYLELRTRDTSKAALDATVARVRTWLETNIGPHALTDLPATRVANDWPGRESMQNITSIFFILAALAVLTAIFLIANTMNTLVTEQSREIGIMKAIGGQRRQIRAVLLRTALILGTAGAVLGVPAGMLLAAAITRYFATDFFSVAAPFGINASVAIASAVFAIGLTIVASLPALRRALRVPVVDALEDRGVAATGFGTGTLDHAIARTRWLPRDAQLGVRNLARNKRRTATTTIQIGLSVALALGLLGLGTSLMRALNDAYASMRYDATASVSSGGRPLDKAAMAITARTPGVQEVSPLLQNAVSYRGKTQVAIGFAPGAPYAPDLKAGDWFTTQQHRDAANVAAVGAATARRYGLHVGDTTTIDTAGGPTRVRVVAVDNNQLNNGSFFFLPLTTLQRLTGWNNTTNGIWLTTTKHDQQFVDRTTAAVEERLIAAGYPVRTDELYVQQRDNRASNQAILDLVNIIGMIIVAISMVGLVSTITMSILERTREIGVLRCIGARAKNIRRAFVAEAVSIGILGWLIGVPLGWLLSRGLVAYMLSVFDIRITAVLPLKTVLLVLVATVTLAALIVLLPVRRGTHLRPGDALRYV